MGCTEHQAQRMPRVPSGQRLPARCGHSPLLKASAHHPALQVLSEGQWQPMATLCEQPGLAFSTPGPRAQAQPTGLLGSQREPTETATCHGHRVWGLCGSRQAGQAWVRSSLLRGPQAQGSSSRQPLHPSPACRPHLLCPSVPPALVAVRAPCGGRRQVLTAPPCPEAYPRLGGF